MEYKEEINQVVIAEIPPTITIEEDIGEFMMNPRQAKLWRLYTNPKSPKTFGNGYQSAMASGYTHESSLVITDTKWFKAKKRKMGLINKAENVMDKILDMDTNKIEADKLRVQSDTAKFIAKTLGKEQGYSERTEVTGKDGGAIIFMPAELIEKHNLKENNIDESDVSPETEGL